MIDAGVRSLRAAGRAFDELNLQILKPTKMQVEEMGEGSGIDYDGLSMIWKGFSVLRFE